MYLCIVFACQKTCVSFGSHSAQMPAVMGSTPSQAGMLIHDISPANLKFKVIYFTSIWTKELIKSLYDRSRPKEHLDSENKGESPYVLSFDRILVL